MSLHADNVSFLHFTSSECYYEYIANNRRFGTLRLRSHWGGSLLYYLALSLLLWWRGDEVFCVFGFFAEANRSASLLAKVVKKLSAARKSCSTKWSINRHHLLLLRRGKLQVKERRAARTKICNPSSTIPRKRTACLPICSSSTRALSKIRRLDNRNHPYPISMVPRIINSDNSSLLGVENKIQYSIESIKYKCSKSPVASAYLQMRRKSKLFPE